MRKVENKMSQGGLLGPKTQPLFSRIIGRRRLQRQTEDAIGRQIVGPDGGLAYVQRFDATIWKTA
ncbi:MAG: hypothetical protein A2V70_05735 [Planctomycetes bacterium RBG_13_63_9]|nr:MAG: hypothetical protein A2V70_05735 [Planctomycetes bacterium RBG_13_63_9]